MARLNTTKHDDEDLPELSTILAENLALSQKKDQSPFGSPNGSAKTTSTVLPEDKKGICKQRSLKIAHVNSLLLSLTGQRASSSEKRVQPDSHIRSSPRRAANQQQKQNSLFPAWNDASDSEDFSSDHMSDFIVSDSYCDSEEEHQSSTYRRPLRVPVKHPKTGRLTASTTDSCSSRAGKGVRLVENEGLLGECSFNTTESLIKKTQGIRSMHLGSTADTFLAEYGFEEPDSLLKL